MKVFISWSGERSRQVAEALREWLPKVLQNVKPWASSIDVEAGARWSATIAVELNATSFGILCVTPESVSAPWLAFEAGALAKTVNASHVCPFLIGMEPAEVPAGPIAQFQAKRATKQETFELVSTLNTAMPAGALDAGQLRETFDVWWPRLDASLRAVPTLPPSEARPSMPAMISEILETVRQLARHREYRDSPFVDSVRQMAMSERMDPESMVRVIEVLKEQRDRQATSETERQIVNIMEATVTRDDRFGSMGLSISSVRQHGTNTVVDVLPNGNVRMYPVEVSMTPAEGVRDPSTFIDVFTKELLRLMSLYR